jgi:4-amino-4-deoxy-L-arabinose transferase-like glycosyltransferase
VGATSGAAIAKRGDVSGQGLKRVMPSLSPPRSDRFVGAFSTLIDGLCDPQRRRRVMLAVVAAYGAAWFMYGLIAKSSQDINADLAEMTVWAHEPALGYPKHPPLLAYVVRAWFAVFPQADWSFLLLAALTLAAGLYLAFELCGLWLEGEKRAAAPFLLAVIPFYNFLGLKFDQNSALIPLWALAMLAFMRSLETRRAGWGVVLGIAAAAAMLTKYWSFFLLAAIFLALIFDHRRNAYLRSPAPWSGAAVFLGLTLPHLFWLIENHFPPLNWIGERRTADSLFDFLRSLNEYSLGTIGYVAPAIVLVALIIRPSGRAVRDSWFVMESTRRPATVLFWTPLLLPIAVAVVKHTNLLSVWNEPSVALLPVMMLASPLIKVSRQAAAWIAACAVSYTVLALIASPFVAYVLLERGVENNAAYARLLAAATEELWLATTDKPLALVGGRFLLVNPVTFYMPDKPASFSDFYPYLSPWATPKRVARGMAIVCEPKDDFCLGAMNGYLGANPSGRRGEVTLTPHWLGFAGAPKRFIIATMPPR